VVISGLLRFKNPAARRLPGTLALGILIALSLGPVVQGQDVSLAKIPATLPPSVLERLTAGRAKLLDRLNIHNQKVDTFNSMCGRVQPNTTLFNECVLQDKNLTAELATLTEDKKQFAAQVDSAVAAAANSPQPNQAATTCTFNTTCVPANANAGGSSPGAGGTPQAPNSATTALDQLRQAAGQGSVANQIAVDPGASEAARHPFDTAGGVAAPMPVVAGTPASAPVLEKIQNMDRYKTMAAEKEKLQNRMNKLDSRLTEIRAEQAKSQTPNQALIMEAAKIKQDMSPIRGEMQLKQQEIDKFVVSMEEESTPDKGKDKTAPKTTPKAGSSTAP
jgi:hypothetical protein